MVSFSLQVAKAFVESFRQSHRQHGTERLDLFGADLPPFEAPQAAAKYAVLSGQTPQGPDAQAWKSVIDVVDDFKSADLYVISSPMWNFGIPYRLKQYIDLIVQPGLTFTYTAEQGYKGLVTGKPAMLVLARGGAYGAGNPNETYDFQRSYLEAVLRFIGFSDIRCITVDGTLQDPAVAQKNLAAALAQASEAASNWP
jgi:FMN-dependent NADH-azoreductase